MRVAEWTLRIAEVTPTESTQQAVGYPALFLLVAIGALVPVIPTGALVSTAAVVALHHSSPLLGLAAVAVVSTLAAFAGDLTLYWLGRRGVASRKGSRLLEGLRRRAGAERIAQAEERLRSHGVTVLVLSRLVPAGRIPVMVACLLARMPTARFARGNLPACAAWAATYGVIGLVGGSVFAEPWQGVALAVGLTVAVSVAPALWRRLRGGEPEADSG
ncbi:DedA family protein [Streptomyces sp. BI20]|uniref:DedA family protein n=1 Tax=Streptomyces sp. BI20 TaxID=3403460 RepID=UPI003C714CA3